VLLSLDSLRSPKAPYRPNFHNPLRLK
jgi:hypothetical protein